MPGQWQGSTRRARLPADWPAIRERVLRRDGRRCQHRDHEGAPVCGELATDVDHVQRGDDHSIGNLRSLCRRHHAIKSSREGNAARRARYARNDEPEAHPGLLPPRR
ncbi:HNH endonuclease signature motif containing protein [Microlunatus lacustris]